MNLVKDETYIFSKIVTLVKIDVKNPGHLKLKFLLHTFQTTVSCKQIVNVYKHTSISAAKLDIFQIEKHSPLQKAARPQNKLKGFIHFVVQLNAAL